MTPHVNRLLYWSPRLLCVLFALFLSLFALDAFSQGYSFWQSVLAFFIHLAPVYLVLLVLLLAWRWEWIGAVVFAILAFLYLVATRGRFEWPVYASISGSLLLIALLFLLNWLQKTRLRSA